MRSVSARSTPNPFCLPVEFVGDSQTINSPYRGEIKSIYALNTIKGEAL